MEDPPLVRCGPGEGPRCVPPAQASILAPAPTLPQKHCFAAHCQLFAQHSILPCSTVDTAEVWVEICVAELICVAHSVVVVSNIDTGLCLLDDGTVFYWAARGKSSCRGKKWQPGSSCKQQQREERPGEASYTVPLCREERHNTHCHCTCRCLQWRSSASKAQGNTFQGEQMYVRSTRHPSKWEHVYIH